LEKSLPITGGDDSQEGEDGMIDQLKGDGVADHLTFQLDLVEAELCGDIPRGSLVATVMSQSQDGAKSRESIKDRQRSDMEMRKIIDFQENGILPNDDKEARELLLSRTQYHLVDGILCYVTTDKTLRLRGKSAWRIFKALLMAKIRSDIHK